MNYEELELKELEKMMEQMAGAPREEYGKRTPGEKCMYEKFRADGTYLGTEGILLAQERKPSDIPTVALT